MFVDAADRDFDEMPGPARPQGQRRGPLSCAEGLLRVALFVQAVSEQKVIYNDNSIGGALTVRNQPSYVRLDIEARYPLLASLEASVFFRNILDAHYQERFGFPSAGRNIGLALRMRL